MNKSKYNILKTVGLEVFKSSLILKTEKETSPELYFSEISNIKLVKTSHRDYTGLWSFLAQLQNEFIGNHATGYPSTIYRITITLHDGQNFISEIQDFDLISVSHAIKQLNQNFSVSDN